MGTGTGSIDLSTLNNLHTNLTQHFWFNSNAGAAYGTGVHMTLSSQAEFIANPTGQNILMNTDGISIRNGTVPLMVLDNDSLDFNVAVDLEQGTYSNVATFGATGFRMGAIADGETRLIANGGGIDLIRRDGTSDSVLAHFGYDYGTPEQPGQPQVENPYYTFGYRLPNYDVGNWSVAEGTQTVASGFASHAEGKHTVASEIYSHAEGYYTEASGVASHAEGYYTEASDHYSHAEGYYTEASSNYSHAEGYHTIAGLASHAEGYHTEASSYAHAEGYHTIAHNTCHVEGQYNVEDTNEKYAHIIGNGTSDSDRSNALAVDWDGNTKVQGKYYANCSSNSEGTAYIGQVFNWQGNLKSNLTANVDAYVEAAGSITLPASHTYLVIGYLAMTNSTNGTTNRRIQFFNKTNATALVTESRLVAAQNWGTLQVLQIFEISADTTVTVRGSANRPTTTIPTAWIRAVCIA